MTDKMTIKEKFKLSFQMYWEFTKLMVWGLWKILQFGIFSLLAVFTTVLPLSHIGYELWGITGNRVLGGIGIFLAAVIWIPLYIVFCVATKKE